MSCSWILLQRQTFGTLQSPSTVRPGLLLLLSACLPAEPHRILLLPRFLLRAWGGPSTVTSPFPESLSQLPRLCFPSTVLALRTQLAELRT